LREFLNLVLIEIPLIKRTKSSALPRILEREAQLIHQAIPHGSRVIALDITGESFSSESLAVKLASLQHSTSHVCILIGGPEGFIRTTLDQCHEYWSLSKLTLPHPLVRVILLETIYRACAINNHHPYHK